MAEPLESQTRNLSSKWDDVSEQVLEGINNSVNRQWQIDEVTVETYQLKRKPHECWGKVYSNQTGVIHLSIGTRVNGGGTKVMGVLIHELVHSLVMSSPDFRFNKPGTLEDLIFDELATDLLAQHVLNQVFKTKIKPMESTEYALDTVSREVVHDKEYRSERDEIIKKINRVKREYLKTNKNYFSFRKELMQV